MVIYSHRFIHSEKLFLYLKRRNIKQHSLMIFIHENSPPRGPKFAEGMKYNANFIRPLIDNLMQLEDLRILPEMTETFRYYIYSLTHDVKTYGHSVILRTSNCHCFVIEITCNHEYDGSPRIYLTLNPFDGNVEDLVFRGRVWDSGLGLVYSALNLVDRLSFYFRYENNSKRFAEKFLTLLGIGFYRCMQDFERVMLMAYGLSAAEIFLDQFFKVPRPQKNPPDFYMMTQIKTLEKAFF